MLKYVILALTAAAFSLLLTPLDDQELVKSSKILITAMARDKQTGAAYSGDGRRIVTVAANEDIIPRAAVKAVTAVLADEHIAAIKAAGKMRSEGKDYVVKDGDVMHFLFNV